MQVPIFYKILSRNDVKTALHKLKAIMEIPPPKKKQKEHRKHM